MANPEQVAMLKRSVEEWNQWRLQCMIQINQYHPLAQNLIFSLDIPNPNSYFSLAINIDLTDADLSYTNLSQANLIGVDLTGTNLSYSNLQCANLAEAKIIKANLQHIALNLAMLGQTDFSKSDLSNADLTGAFPLSANFTGSNLSDANLSHAKLDHANLRDANLSRVNLNYAQLFEANLINTNLNQANLSNANLKRCKAIKTNFEYATLTGSCIQDWHINDQTKLDHVICEYIYLKNVTRHYGYFDFIPQQKQSWINSKYAERRPSDESKIFNQGDFQRLIETSKETIDLIFSQGIDWNAFLTSFNNLHIEDGYHTLSVKAIEQKDDGTFVVRVNAPPNIDKGEIEKRFFNKYQRALKKVTKQYKQRLQAKDKEIEIYHQQNTNLYEIIKLQASQPIIVQAQATSQGGQMSNINQSHSGKGDNNANNNTTHNNFTGANFGGGFAQRDYTGSVKNVTNNYADSSLNETVKEIERLINQLSQNTPTDSMSDNLKIATQAIERIETTPTWKEKAIQASQQGLLEAMKSHPIGAFVAGAIEGWKS